MKEEDLDKIRDLYTIKNALDEKLLQIDYYKKAELYLLLQLVGSNISTGPRILGSKEHPLDKCFRNNKKEILNFLLSILEEEQNKTISEKRDVEMQIDKIEIRF